jgi:hypothetical protein
MGPVNALRIVDVSRYQKRKGQGERSIWGTKVGELSQVISNGEKKSIDLDLKPRELIMPQR